MDNLEIICQWSDEVTPQFLNDFMFCINEVFGPNSINIDSFRKKYIDNIYGASLLTIAYVKGEPAGVDAMWRNDLNGKIAYQTIDTCVLSKYRGLGIFKKLTETEISTIGENAIYYGFPNENSFPGYLKFGWKYVATFSYAFRFGLKKAISECTEIISKEYFDWRIKDKNSEYSAIKRNNHYALVKKTRFPFALRYIGLIDEEFAKQLPQTKFCLFFFYYSNKPSLIHKNEYQNLISYGQKRNIPYWKFDCFS